MIAVPKIAGCNPLGMEAADYLEEAYAVLSLISFNLGEGEGGATYPIVDGAVRGAQSLVALAHWKIVGRAE